MVAGGIQGMTVCGHSFCGLCGSCEHLQVCRNSELAKVPMTNEEWIHSLSTEQLAEILVCMAEDKSETKTVHKENVGKCVEWLKQPHTK